MATIIISGNRNKMKAIVSIPRGWRKLDSAERVEKGDRYLRTDMNNPYWEKIMPRIGSYIHYQVCNICELVIRKIPPQGKLPNAK